MECVDLPNRILCSNFMFKILIWKKYKHDFMEFPHPISLGVPIFKLAIPNIPASVIFCQTIAFCSLFCDQL